jgi:hypothetical protein
MISFRPTGELKYEVEVHYIEDPVLGYRPARATAVTFRGGHVRQQRYLDVHSVVLNPPFSDSDFQLTFPAGTRVYDERTNNEYVAGELTLATRENQDVAAPAQQIAPVAGPPVNGGPATSRNAGGRPKAMTPHQGPQKTVAFGRRRLAANIHDEIGPSRHRMLVRCPAGQDSQTLSLGVMYIRFGCQRASRPFSNRRAA